MSAENFNSINELKLYLLNIKPFCYVSFNFKDNFYNGDYIGIYNNNIILINTIFKESIINLQYKIEDMINLIPSVEEYKFILNKNKDLNNFTYYEFLYTSNKNYDNDPIMFDYKNSKEINVTKYIKYYPNRRVKCYVLNRFNLN
jgi:hypothetical protein